MYPLKFNGNFGLVIFENFFEFLCILKCLVPLLFSPVSDNVDHTISTKTKTSSSKLHIKDLITFQLETQETVAVSVADQFNGVS